MPMELRKRKAPTNPPPPAPPKRTKSAAAKKEKTVTEKVVEKAKDVKDAVVAAAPTVATATTTTKKAAPKKKGATAAAKEAKEAEKAAEPAPAPVEEKKPEPAAEAAPAAEAEPAVTASAPAPAKKGRGKAAAAKDAAKDTAAEVKADAKSAAAAAAPAASAPATKLKVGDTLPTDLGEITLHDGTKTTFGDLLKSADKGIVLFSYTKASTPGCTSQACALRDNHSAFTSAGYSVYGLSGDSPADNAKFRTKQNLGYSLLSDPSYTFHEKLGIKNATKAGGVRSVIVVQKEGAIIKEHKTVTAKNGLDFAKKAAGIETTAAPAASAATEAPTTKTVAVGSSAPEATDAAKA